MDVKAIGEVIRKNRIKKKLTQRELASKLFISDKAVSKWERGKGMPDLSILSDLADCLNISVELLLNGVETNVDDKKNGMKKMSFYVCDQCSNVICSTNEASVICCNKKLNASEVQKTTKENDFEITYNDGMQLLQFDHSVTKEHYIKFVAIRRGVSVNIIPTHPEWEINIRDVDFTNTRIYFYCSEDGLFSRMIK